MAPLLIGQSSEAATVIDEKYYARNKANCLSVDNVSSTVESRHGQPLLRKIAVIMTDGKYKQKCCGYSSATRARAICEELQDAGIVVYTVGFAIAESGEAYETMKKCASTNDHYYHAHDGGALRLACRDIALKIATLRLTQ